MKKNTKYRIITLNGLFGKRRHLQFYSRGWRYVPEQMNAYVFGRYLNEKSCPRFLILRDEYDFIHCDEFDEKAFLIPFTKAYVYIDEYFKHLNKLRLKYLKEEKERELNKLPDTFYL